MSIEQIVAEGFSAIRRMVDEGQEESHKIDFKMKSDPSRTDLSRDDRKALGEAASGFANAEGGLLVIGIETEDSNGIDRAKKIQKISDVETVADRYASYLSECVSPPVEGIKVTAVKEEPEESGVIVISIPKGSTRPHMSVASGHHRFYRRTADRFQQMERYEIEEMFRLKDSPSLELMLEYQPGGSISGNIKTFICFGLRNSSKSSAKFPYISLIHNANAPKVAEYGLDGNGGSLFRKLTTGPGQESLFSGGSNIVLHPGQSLFISRLEYLHSYDNNNIHRYWSASSLSPTGTCEVEFSFGCEDCPKKSVRAIFKCSDLLNLEMPTLNVV